MKRLILSLGILLCCASITLNAQTANYSAGTGAGASITTGSFNVFVGDGAGSSTTTGSYNVFTGYRSGFSNTTAEQNLFSGYRSGYNNTANYNTLLGYEAGFQSTSGIFNTYVGHSAGWASTTCAVNVFIGHAAGYKTTTGGFNSFVGRRSAFENTRGTYNVAFGHQAGDFNTSGDFNTFLGSEADATDSLLNNSTAIGYTSSVSTSNTMVFGNDDVTKWAFGLTTTGVGKAIEVGTDNTDGNGAYLTSTGTWTNTSDRNKKEGITQLDKDFILNGIKKLPITRWSYIGDESGVTHIGPMAQDFYEIFNVGNNNVSISTIDPAGIALAGIKELIKSNETLEQENEQLQAEVQELVHKNEALEAQAQALEQKYEALDAAINELRAMQTECCNAINPSSHPQSPTSSDVDDQPYLEQNMPNPFNQNTTIRYYLPKRTSSAIITVRSSDGKEINRFQVSEPGKGQIIVSTESLAPGIYVYDLVVNGRQVDVKQMIIAK